MNKNKNNRKRIFAIVIITMIIAGMVGSLIQTARPAVTPKQPKESETADTPVSAEPVKEEVPSIEAGIHEITTGHINRTYRLSFTQADGAKTDYILQRISTQAFKHPDQVMENVLLVTEHIRSALEAHGEDASNRVLRVIPTRDGSPLFTDAEGGAWRVYNFIQNAHSVDVVESSEQFRAVGRAFGDFQNMLSDFPIERLHDTIPDFHNTVRRIAVCSP